MEDGSSNKYCPNCGVMLNFSPNIMIIPLNPEGALELGVYPCQYCNQAWMRYSTTDHTNQKVNAEIKGCYETCDYWKRWEERFKLAGNV